MRCPEDQASTAKGLPCRLVWPGLTSAFSLWPPPTTPQQEEVPHPTADPTGLGGGYSWGPLLVGPLGDLPTSSSWHTPVPAE